MTVTTTPTVERIGRYLHAAAEQLADDGARYLVDSYYQLQRLRIATTNQARALADGEEPDAVTSWLAKQMEMLETRVRQLLDDWTAGQPLGTWARSHVGVGPVIAAGLLAEIDFDRARTAGQIWRFAGLDPTVTWGKGQKRPWNARLKTLTWKLGESFKRASSNEACFYGRLYRQRKEYEVQRNESGGNAQIAAEQLAAKSYRADTATRKRLEEGRLPDGQLDLRAMRWAVKIFLAHMLDEAYRQRGETPPAPYPIAHLGHAHRIEAPETA